MKDIKGTEDYTVTTSEGRVLVDFWAEWCPPCKAMLPLLEELDGKDGVTIVKVDTEDQDNYDLVSGLEIRSIPTFLYFEDGVASVRWTGTFKEEDWNNVTKVQDDD